MIRFMLYRLILTLWCTALMYVAFCLLALFLRRTVPQLDFILEMGEQYRWILALLVGLALANLLAPWMGF